MVKQSAYISFMKFSSLGVIEVSGGDVGGYIFFCSSFQSFVDIAFTFCYIDHRHLYHTPRVKILRLRGSYFQNLKVHQMK